MKNIAIAIFVALIIVTLGLYLISFQVRETESCLKTTFGKATIEDEITEPGWYFKWPFPIQQVHRFDSRMRTYEVESEETTTAGGDPIIVSTYVVWKISRPLEFFNATKTVKRAQDEILHSRIRNAQNNVIGRHYFSEFVNNDPSKIAFEAIQNEMLTTLQQDVTDTKCGIEIAALGIKQLKVSEEVSKAVFERMKAERTRIEKEITSGGEGEAVKIRTDAESKRDELIAAAEARATAIRGKGDAEAAKHYERLEADPELAMLLRDIESLQKMLEDKTTFVTPTDMRPFELLKGLPELKPAEPDQSKK
ncbi:MAG: protease modulator HflC, partial [Sedimentisphaerales bacterium]|nr:protease modulator HflC [Sedimentisphaerales bacterium]